MPTKTLSSAQAAVLSDRREEALEAEERAIREKCPRFNTTHNGQRQPVQELRRIAKEREGANQRFVYHLLAQMAKNPISSWCSTSNDRLPRHYISRVAFAELLFRTPGDKTREKTLGFIDAAMPADL